jgi:cell fate regulator YaaT (PSP1 superfamily)
VTATATIYLIQYGRPGFVGRFRGEFPVARGNRVIVRTPRGIEFGEVLIEPKDRGPHAEDGKDDGDGTILRLATADDEAEAARLDRLTQEVLAASSIGNDQPLAFIDVEATLDGTAILHALPWDTCDATPLLDELAVRFGLRVRLLDLSHALISKEPSEPAGCGKPGCGSEGGGGGCSSCGTGGGGCSTGSCSRGAVKSADDLTAYFTDLRGKMEAAGIVRTPLN